MRLPDDRDRFLDPAELGFRRDSVPAGGWITFIAVGTAAVYVIGWSDGHSGAFAALLALGAVGGVVALLLPWDAILRSRFRELAFVTWSLLDVALIMALAGVDGGGDSPLALLLFIPIVFAAVSYPLASVVVVGGVVLGSYAGLAAAAGAGGGGGGLFLGSLPCPPLVSGWEGRHPQRPPRPFLGG